MRNTTVSRQLLLLGLIVSSGCAIGPDYTEPELPIPSEFAGTATAPETFLAESAGLEWWKGFNDPLLDSLIVRAVERNKDIDVALSRVNEARAVRREAFTSLFPGGTARSEYESSQVSTVRFPGGSREGFSYELYAAGVDVYWEIDLLGRLRRNLEAQDAAYGATVAGLQDAIRLVVAEVAQYYFQLRNAQEQLSIARANERNQLSTVDYVGARRDAGRATELDYSRVRALLEGTRATIPPLERAVRSATYRISVLLGELPTTLTNELLSVQPLPAYTGPVRLGDPKDLLRRRPDLRAAERELASAVASVGVATGDLYPKITFEGSLGVEAASPSDWTSGTASTYRLGPRLSWGIFEYGRTISRVRVADARSDQALSRYEHAVLRALEETENALLSFSSERERRGRLKLAVEASAKALSLIQEQYELGGTDLSTVLEVQRTALQNESQLSQSNLDLNVALVSVYKALGGGWEGYAIEGSELAPTAPVAPSENQG